MADERDTAREDAAGAGDPGADATVIHEAQDPDEGAGERIAALIEQDAPPTELARELEEVEPADAADALEALEPEATAEVLDEMTMGAAADALAHMELPLAASVLTDLNPAEGARLIARMDPDDAADLLQTLPRDVVDAVLRALPRKTAAALGKLVLYDPESAGGIMTTEFLKLRSSSRVADALAYLRQRRSRLEGSDIYSIYCIDDEGRLEGVLDLRSLLVADPDQRIGEIMDREVDALRPDLDREEVARAFDRYDFFALPVVDENRRVLGVVTVDDVIDIIRAEHTEDTFKQVGAGKAESVYAPVRIKLRGRVPWLLVNLATTQIPAVIVIAFSSVIDSITLLAAVMGMIANQSGNAGQQSLAVTLRGLVLGEVRPERVAPLVVREVIVGVVSGAVTGLIVAGLMLALRSAGWIEADWRLGLIVALAMTGAVSIGCLTGAVMPILMKRMGFDPATASTIFLTTVTDAISFLSLLGLAWLLKGWLIGGSPAGG